MKWAIVACLAGLVGCTTTSRVGPYVKQVTRQGDWLIIQKCVIQLEGDALQEVDCTAEQLPLRSFPPQGMPAIQQPPGMQQPPMPQPPPHRPKI